MKKEKLEQLKKDYEFSSPLCLDPEDGKDMNRFKEFVTPYFANLFGSEEFGECSAEELPDEIENLSKEEQDKIQEAWDFSYRNEDCYDFLTQPKFFAHLIKTHELIGTYALNRYIDDLKQDIDEYTEALRKYVEGLIEDK